MKKKIVYLLCELGLNKLAYIISPSIAFLWRGEQTAKGLKKAFDELSKEIEIATIGIKELAKQYNDSKTEHKCNGCKYKGEHQEMMFKPMGVCTKEKELSKAVKNYNAEKCPYDL